MKGKKSEKEQVQIVTRMEIELKKELFKALIDDDMSFREWVERNARTYLKRKERKK
ncbi:MAG: hypothetical protein GTN76_10190 [Candidatus Aenigmarchaeota archaeon]|nr:hypothetical protein [Candidatus Aenigmarchaeota archaeon]